MEMTEYEPGTPSWVDLGTSDSAAAAEFYGGLFGWESEEGPPEAGGYRMCLLKGKPVAGLGPQMNEGVPPTWTTYVTVADVDAAAAAVRTAGGTVVLDPFDVMDVGRMAVCMDTTGAAFSLWQPRTHIGASVVNEPGSLCWDELTTRDPDKAVEFYAAVFGWKAETAPMGGSPYTTFRNGERTIAGMTSMDDSFGSEILAHWLVYFGVEDCDASLAKVTELGGTVLMPAVEVPDVGRFAVCSDPQGAVFAFIAMPEETS